MQKHIGVFYVSRPKHYSILIQIRVFHSYSKRHVYTFFHSFLNFPRDNNETILSSTHTKLATCWNPLDSCAYPTSFLANRTCTTLIYRRRKRIDSSDVFRTLDLYLEMDYR